MSTLQEGRRIGRLEHRHLRARALGLALDDAAGKQPHAIVAEDLAARLDAQPRADRERSRVAVVLAGAEEETYETAPLSPKCRPSRFLDFVSFV